MRRRTHASWITLLAAVGFILTGGPGWALDASDLTFYAPFDGSLEAACSSGEPKPRTVQGEYSFVPGMLGQAVLAGETGKQLAYAVAGNLPDSQGTISLWLKTLDWAAGDMQEHDILSIRGQLYFHAAANSGGVHFIWQTIGGNTYSYPNGPHKGEWKQLVYTWSEGPEGHATLWQNGQFVRRIDLSDRVYFHTQPKSLPRWAPDLLFHLCDAQRTVRGNNKTVVDELMVFRRPLDATEIRSLYRRVTAPLLETRARIGRAARAPVADGRSRPGEWAGSAAFTDFVGAPFGTLSRRAVRANLTYDARALYVAVSAGAGKRLERDDRVEVWLAPDKGGAPPRRFLLHADGRRAQYRGGQTFAAAWKGAARRTPAPAGGSVCFEAAIPWAAAGVGPPKDGSTFRLDLIRRWSGRYADYASWAGPAAIRPAAEPEALARATLGGARPVLALRGLGRLDRAQLALAGTVVSPARSKGSVRAEVRLQPCDFKEYYDPKTLPGTKSYTGTQLNRDRLLPLTGPSAELRVAESFSDTDIDSLWLRLTDASGGVIYQAQRPYVPEPPITLSVRTYPDHDRLDLLADISSYRDAPPETLRAEVQVVAPNGKPAGVRTIAPFGSRREVASLPLKPLPTGALKARAVLWHGKERVSEFTVPFSRPAPGPWVGSRLGKDDIVIAPFTPVKVAGQQVSVWGRTYTWQDSLFPVQVSSAGQDLLAAPVELVAGAEAVGRPNAAQVRVVEQGQTGAVVECTGTLAGVPVTARHTIEYDGLCLTELRLQAEAGAQLQGLWLRIPYRPEQATLYMATPPGTAGAVAETVNPLGSPMNGGRALGFQNTVWLGTEDRGMTWFAEDGKGWRFRDNPAPMEIRSAPDASVFTVRFAGGAFQADGPISLRFGLIATPVKALPRNWRFQRCGRDWQYRWYGPFSASNNDIAHPKAEFRTLMEQKHREGIPLYVIYQMPIWINTRQPECAYYGEEWMVPPRAIAGNDDGGPDRHLIVCLGSRWQDFMVHYAVKAYGDLHMDGYYFDGAQPMACTNALHGHGWTDDTGTLRPTYTILAQREFFRRLAVEFHKRGRPSLLFAHMSGCIEAPAVSFFDMQWNGEHFSTSATPARNYNKLVTLPYFRALFLGQPFGIPQQWLVEYFNQDNAPPIGKAEIDTVLELALVHGVGDHVLASNLATTENADYIRRVLDAQDKFGVREADCVFHPYWRAGPASVEPATQNVVCSLWQRPGKVLLVAANCTGEDHAVVIRLDARSLGLAGGLKASDVMTQEPIPVDGASVRVALPRWSWKLIEVRT